MVDRARDYQPGERVPGTVYQVGRLIGAGGMGTVYDVEDTTIGKRYVLKTLHPQLGAREDLARRMQNEARTLARLHHPNIVEVFTAGVTGDDMRLPYYVMERLNGQSLRLVLDKKGQLELPHAYHIAIDLLDALDHAHDKGVIHRDVKPDNIFLHRTSAGVTVTKLLDFGILSLLDSTSRETAGRFLGTLRYAAPEQLRGDKASPKVDVYAAGLVLFEMVAGRGPFDDAGDPHKIAAAHLHKPAPLLSHFVVVPPELDSLVNAALSKLPEHRPRDAFSFAASLRNLKKALGGVPGLESTENRATAAAVVGMDSAPTPFVSVRHPSPEGPYVIQPGVVPTPPSAIPAAGPRTTMKGMPAPSAVGSIAMPGSQPPTAVSPGVVPPPSIDRAAPTNSIVASHPFAPVNGTPPGPHAPQPQGVMTPIAYEPTLASDAPPPASVAPFHWPAERPGARSEEPQTRTVSQVPELPRRSAAPVVAAILVTVAILVTAGVLAVVKLRGPRSDHQASSTAPSVAATPNASIATAPPAPAPEAASAPPVANDPAAGTAGSAPSTQGTSGAPPAATTAATPTAATGPTVATTAPAAAPPPTATAKPTWASGPQLTWPPHATTRPAVPAATAAAPAAKAPGTALPGPGF